MRKLVFVVFVALWTILLHGNTINLTNLHFDVDPVDNKVEHDVVVVISNPNSSTVFFNMVISGTSNGQPWNRTISNIPILSKNSEFHSFNENSTSDQHAAWGGLSELWQYGPFQYIRETIPWPFHGSITISSSSTVYAYSYSNGTIEYATPITGDPRDKTDCTLVYGDYQQYLQKYNTSYQGRTCVVLPWLDLWETYQIIPGWKCYVKFLNYDTQAPYFVEAIFKDAWQCQHQESDWEYITEVPAAEREPVPGGGWQTIPGTVTVSLNEFIFQPHLVNIVWRDNDWSDIFAGVVFLSKTTGQVPTVEFHYMIDEEWYN